MAYIQKNNPFIKSPLRQEKKAKKKSKPRKKLDKYPHQEYIDKGIEEGWLPKPDTWEKLEQYKKAYHREIPV
tara:strand:- start:252 stop:467 length:216 start_codon:yes stop_codon:yes gene_type:complete